ncbi:aminopeptidase N [Nocardioides sp.]|uniref:aminopeptidase N n=1 Tax=Nocardioides sp. TaxID=35761 RepID=UPI003517D7DD
MSLTRVEAEHRASLLHVESYEVALDLTGGDDPDHATFDSHTTLRFTVVASGTTFADVRPETLHRVVLDGREITDEVRTAIEDDGRLPLELTAGEHVLEVAAAMPYRSDGEGLHRSVDPADGLLYVYGMSFMEAAPTVFACFDQPDLKAPYSVTVTAPSQWLVRGNGRVRREAQTDASAATRRWSWGPTPPLATYFVTVVAGPYHLVEAEHDGIALGFSARRSLAEALEREAPELIALTAQSFDELHRLFGVRYAFGDYHQAFVPEFNAGAMENPGCITIRDQLLFEGTATRADRSFRAALIAHEMAHQWFGNLVTPQWWDDLWLNESFAEYMGYRVAADATAYDDAWLHQSYARRTWGLTADARPTTHPVAGNAAEDAASALQNFDGISYARGSNVLRQLATRLGDEAFLAGVRDHFAQHRFANATMHDLIASWERASGDDLGDFVDAWLLTPGPDVLELDRVDGVVRRRSPAAHPAQRRHEIVVATHRDGRWERSPLVVDDTTTAFAAGDSAVLLDATESTWALTPPDALTMALLPRLAGAMDDPQLVATMWNSVRLALFDAAVRPAQVADLLVAAPPVADTADGVRSLLPWAIEVALPLCPDGTTERFHAALRAAADHAPAGSEVRLAAFRAVVLTATEVEELERWAAGGGLPDGIEADVDLRWKARRRLAEIGGTDRAALDAALADAPSGTATVAHARAVASLPTTEAKEFAWARALGEVRVPNYELAAAGAGMWRPDQLALTAPYAEAYVQRFSDLVEAHRGWVQATAVEAFFPITHVDAATLGATRHLLTADLAGAVRRPLADRVDELARRLAVR